MTPSQGADISAWQGAIDFATMKAKLGQDGFVFIRAAVGWIDKAGDPHADADANFAAYWPAAKAAGIKRGAFVYYHQGVSAGDQFMALLKAVNNNILENVKICFVSMFISFIFHT